MDICDFIRDLGYGSTYNTTVLAACLEQLGLHPTSLNSKLSEFNVARILCTMCQTHTGLCDAPTLASLYHGILNDSEAAQLRLMSTWNVECVFPLLMKYNPRMDWARVLRSLDSVDGFSVDKMALGLILKASKAVIQVCLFIFFMFVGVTCILFTK